MHVFKMKFTNLLKQKQINITVVDICIGQTWALHC